jgi:hypothetical protein
MTKSPRPVVSVVAVSRNDDHGGDMRGRMQHFVNCLFYQCREHQLEAELILVEWNPPPDRPPLEMALAWPADFGPLSVRIVTVPAQVHAEFAHSRELPLFQMIGKNVGIRRARGQFVLATNVDILLGDSIICYLRDELKPGTIVRADRYDVPSDLSRQTDIRQLLADCSKRFFQVCVRYGVFDVQQSRILGMGDHLAAKLVAAHCSLRVFGIGETLKRGARRTLLYGRSAWRDFSLLPRLPLPSLLMAWRIPSPRAMLRRLAASSPRVVLRKLATLPSRLTKLLLNTLSRGMHIVANRVQPLIKIARRLVKSVSARWSRSAADRRLEQAQRLHTVACGDFTLLSRDDWFRLQGYPEWPIFSWHIDSVFMYAASVHGLKEVALGAKYRIFHIDHSIGSGWSAAGEKQLFARLDNKGIPYLSNEDVRRLQQDFADDPDRSVFNGENWGLGDRALPERVIVPQGGSMAAEDGQDDRQQIGRPKVGASACEHV